MDEAKVYRKIGVILVSIWIIVWAILVVYILKLSHPYDSRFESLMFQTIYATILNLAINPCAFIGAILLGLAGMMGSHVHFSFLALEA